jgi:hypothetical protein
VQPAGAFPKAKDHGRIIAGHGRGDTNIDLKTAVEVTASKAGSKNGIGAG